MMLFVICSVLPLFYGALASPLADQYIDNILRVSLPGQLRGLNMDPAPLPDFSTDFEDKIVLIGKVKGKANYTQGQLTGLSHVERFSQCGGPSYKFGAPTVNCTIGFQYLKTSYNGKMKYGKMPVVPIKASANATTTKVFIEISAQKLTQFYMVQVGQFEPKFTGLGKPLNKFLKVLADGYKTHVGAVLMNQISQSFQHALSLAAYQIPMPS